MNEQDRNNLFSDLVARHQSELYGYIFAVLRSWQDADDVFQAVCLVLWRKFGEFRPGTSFFAWARQTARIELSKFLRERKSPSAVTEQLLEELAEAAAEVEHNTADDYLSALRRCKQKLGAMDEQLLELHYAEELGSRQIAARLRRPQHSICHSLNRIRSWLLACIQKDMARQDHVGGGSR